MVHRLGGQIWVRRNGRWEAAVRVGSVRPRSAEEADQSKVGQEFDRLVDCVRVVPGMANQTVRSGLA
ncbi:hypothetical protein GCM10010411_55790 [Actinomadura fulvescens]|uniref:Uncharacterized protein n=1 Tax=Actinomadura fulvescens TaxID=46160 RepID=A0ABP6CFS3_9ACTN